MKEIESVGLQLIQNMARDEVEEYIDKEELAKIKETDSNPRFDVFRIAHTGKSESHIVGRGNKILRWFNDAIKKIHENLKIGLKAFAYHKKDSNDHYKREEVGRLVGKFYKEDDSKNADSYGIVYRFPGSDDSFDMASYEGKMLLPEDTAMGAVVAPENIREVSGIALGHGEKKSPAFPKAVRMLQFCIQNMIDESKDDEHEQKEADNAEEDKEAEEIKEVRMEPTLEEVKKFIKENKVTPSNLFDRKSLESDETVLKIANERNKETHFVVLRRDDKIAKLEAENKDLADKLGNKDAEIQKAVEKSVSLIAEKNILDVFAGRKLSEKSPILEKWVKRKLKGFKPSGDEKKIDREAEAYIDSLIDDFNSYEKDGIAIALKEEDKPKEKPAEKEKAKDADKETPEIKKEDIVNPDYSKIMADRVAELNK